MKGVLFRGGMLVYAARYWRPLQRLADDPDAAQAQVLRELLARNSGTEFGIAVIVASLVGVNVLGLGNHGKAF